MFFAEEIAVESWQTKRKRNTGLSQIKYRKSAQILTLGNL